MPLTNLTGFQRDLLTVIAGRSQPSGQEIKDDVEQDLNLDVTHGRLYPNLDTLVDKDLVEKGAIDRRTNYYEATDKGLERLQSHMEWQREKVQEAVSPSVK